MPKRRGDRNQRRQLSLVEWVEQVGGRRLAGMSGLLVAELCSLNVESITLEAGHTVPRFIGKGGKPAEIPLPIPMSYAVSTYIGSRTAEPIFLNRRGQRLTVDNASLLVKKLARAAHLDPNNVSPHSLRRTFCTAGLTQGVPLREMQIAMRHVDPKTTGRYDMAKNNMDRHASHRVAYRRAAVGEADWRGPPVVGVRCSHDQPGGFHPWSRAAAVGCLMRAARARSFCVRAPCWASASRTGMCATPRPSGRSRDSATRMKATSVGTSTSCWISSGTPAGRTRRPQAGTRSPLRPCGGWRITTRAKSHPG